MHIHQVAVAVAAGVVMAAGGIVAVDVATEDAEAQSASQFATRAELKGANSRASAAINMGKRVWNLLGIYSAEPDELVGAKSGPIAQQRGQGGGLPESVLSAGVQAKLNAAGSGGPQGPTGPGGPKGDPGAQGPQGPRGPSHAYFRDRPLSEAIPLATTFTPLLTLDVPAGKYTAASDVVVGADAATAIQCRLSGPGGVETLSLESISSAGALASMSNHIGFEAATATSVLLACQQGGGTSATAAGRISVTEVGDLTIQPPATL